MRRKSLTQKLKEAKEQIKELESKLQSVEADREVFRDRTVYMLKELIRLYGTGHYWNTDSQMEYIIKTLHETEKFYW